MLDWLLLPIDAARAHEISITLSWHARLMVLSWGTLTPAAILIARFYKITPRQNWPHELDNRLWWNAHFLGQTGSFLIACIAVLLIWNSQQALGGVFLHKVLGYSVMVLGFFQVGSGLLRGTKGGPTAPSSDDGLRGDHYDMTRRRLAFEFVHKTVGYIALGLIIIAILTGLWGANAPVWMWLAISGWWLLLLGFGVWLQKKERAYDTYQAIWGAGLQHPGNVMPKQGYGTVRPSEIPRFKQREKD